MMQRTLFPKPLSKRIGDWVLCATHRHLFRGSTAFFRQDVIERYGSMCERTDLLHALGQLAAEEKQIVILSVIEGYTAKEIAAIVGSPQGTVSSKLFRAFKKMRKHLEGGKQS